MMLSQQPYPVEPDVHKIAVLRANGIGDFVFALPALEALRSTYPAAEIVLLAKPWHAMFLADRPTRSTESLSSRPATAYVKSLT